METKAISPTIGEQITNFKQKATELKDARKEANRLAHELITQEGKFRNLAAKLLLEFHSDGPFKKLMQSELSGITGTGDRYSNIAEALAITMAYAWKGDIKGGYVSVPKWCEQYLELAEEPLKEAMKTFFGVEVGFKVENGTWRIVFL